jgi:hypothetical protein
VPTVSGESTRGAGGALAPLLPKNTTKSSENDGKNKKIMNKIVKKE